MFNVGQMCVKIAGRDAGKKCVIVEVIDNNYVLVDGMTRRRKCNKVHLEPLNQKLDIKANATHEDVVKAFKTVDLEIITTKPKSKTVKPKPNPRGKEKTDAVPKKAKKSKAVKAEALPKKKVE